MSDHSEINSITSEQVISYPKTSFFEVIIIIMAYIFFLT